MVNALCCYLNPFASDGISHMDIFKAYNVRFGGSKRCISDYINTCTYTKMPQSIFAVPHETYDDSENTRLNENLYYQTEWQC